MENIVILVSKDTNLCCTVLSYCRCKEDKIMDCKIEIVRGMNIKFTEFVYSLTNHKIVDLLKLKAITDNEI